MKRVKCKAYQNQSAEASMSAKRERRCHFGDTQDQFFGFPTERLDPAKFVARSNKKQLTEPTMRSNFGAPNRTLINKSVWSADDQYLTHLDHMISEKVSAKKSSESSKIAEDNTQCAPVTCKRTWLRQVKLPTSTSSAVNPKHRCSPSRKASPCRTNVTRKESNAFKCKKRELTIVPHRFSNSDCVAKCRNVSALQVKDDKNLSPEYLNLQTLLENQIKSVPSQSWSVNADAIPSLRRSSTTVFSHKTCLKPSNELSFLNRETGDLTGWVVQGLGKKKVGQPNLNTEDQTKKLSENSHPLTDSSKSKSSNVVIHQNIKKKILTHRKISLTMSKPKYKPKRSEDQARLNDSTESQSLNIQHQSRLNRHMPDSENEETDLSMIPMKDSDSIDSLTSSSSNNSDKVVNMSSKCSTANSWDPYTAHAKEDLMACSNKPYSAYAMNFDPLLNHLQAVAGESFRKPQKKSGELEPFMRIRVKSSKVEAVPVKPTLTSMENMNSLTDSGDWSKFTPVCHIYNGSATSKLSSLNVGSRCDDDSVKVININDPTFFKASDTAVISELKDTTSTWMTGHLGTHSCVSFTSSVVEERTLESKKDDMPAGFRVNANRITLHVESMGVRLQHNNKTCMQSNSEQSRSNIQNELESAERSQISRSSSSDGVSETNRAAQKIIDSFNKQEDRKNSSMLKKHNLRSEKISMTKKNIVNVIPPKSKMTQLSAANAHDNFIKRAFFHSRKQNCRNIFGKTITNRHKGFKDKSKYLRSYVLPKQDKFSARFSPVRKTKKTNHGAIPTDRTKSTFNRVGETSANTKDLNKDNGQQRRKFSPSRLATKPVAADQLGFVSTAETQRKTRELQRPASYPSVMKINQKMLLDEIPVTEQSIQKAETVVLTVTNVQTSTTEHSTQGEAANRECGRRFRIRVFVKPLKKRPDRSLAQEANMAMPVTFGEDEKADDVKCETTRSSKSVDELSNRSSGAESTSTQFQSLQDFQSASYSKNDPTGIVCKDKPTCDHGSVTGVEPLSKPLRVKASYSSAPQVAKESFTVWGDVISPSPKVRKVKSPHSQVPSLPRYPRRLERRPKVKSSWNQVHSEITPIVRPLILVMFFLCVVYLTLMTAFSLHTIQRY